MTCGTQPFRSAMAPNADRTHDALGSVRVVTDAAGSVVGRYDADVWGNELPSTDDGVPGGFRMRWVGALGVRLDDASGLYQMGQRWYDPTLQIFLSREPLSATSKYAYCGLNPARFTDESGLAKVDQSLYKKYPYYDTVLARLKSALSSPKLGPCSRAYDYSAGEMRAIAQNLLAVLNAPSVKITFSSQLATGKGDRGMHTYRDKGKVVSRITVFDQDSIFAKNPNLTPEEILAENLLHEVGHELIDRMNDAARRNKPTCPEPNVVVESSFPGEFGHRFIDQVVDCILPRTKNLYEPIGADIQS